MLPSKVEIFTFCDSSHFEFHKLITGPSKNHFRKVTIQSPMYFWQENVWNLDQSERIIGPVGHAEFLICTNFTILAKDYPAKWNLFNGFSEKDENVKS